MRSIPGRDKVNQHTKKKREDGPLLHGGIIKHTIELRAGHHDRMKPMTSSKHAREKDSV